MHHRIVLAALLSLFACDLSGDSGASPGTEGDPATSAATTAGSTGAPSGSTGAAPSDTGTMADSSSGSTSQGDGTAAAASTTGESETGAAHGAYEPCPNGTDDCPAGTECQMHGAQLSFSHWCAATCADEGRSCPLAPEGDAEPTCFDVANTSVCALSCDPERLCPQGMECRSFGGSGGDAGLCVWPN